MRTQLILYLSMAGEQTTRDFASPDTEATRIMKARLERIIGDEKARESARADFVYTFGQLGLEEKQAADITTRIFALLVEPWPLKDIEADCLRLLAATEVESDGGERQSLVAALEAKLSNRAEIIFKQVAPYLRDIAGPVIDYGAGDGQVAQRLHDKAGLAIEGVDVRSYVQPDIMVPIKLFDGARVPVADKHYEAAVLTNVLHHEKDNEKIINELDRIVQKRLVILETIPLGETDVAMEGDKDRTFMNDYMYNRLFHSADVPVPGTFEIPSRWRERFAAHGWRVAHEEDLGIDQPTIKDRHYLLVFERAV